jgi:hypothetical protein
MEYLKSIPSEYYLYGSLGILLLGIILGFTKTIVVYRDYSDLTKVFMLVLAPVAIFAIIGDKVDNKIVRNILLVIEGIIILWILVTTYLDNRNIFKTLLAIITKIPLGVIFAFYLVNLIAPSGKSMSNRSKSRGVSGLVMIFLAPILYGLVRNRVWSLKSE